MLKTIPVDELRVGMAVADIPGPWMAHGRWKTHFVIRDPADLAALRECGITAVVIDTDRGPDVLGSEPEPEDATGPDAAGGPAAPEEAPGASRQPARSPGQLWAGAQALVADTFDQVRASGAIDTAAVTGAVDDILQALERDRFAIMGLGLLKDYDTYTFAHSVSVCALLVAFGQHLKLDAAHCRALGAAGLFHDIGKAAVSDALILKPGPLTDDEFSQVRQHPALGARYLERMRQDWPIAIDVCLHHHERIDGSGYLRGRQGDEISLESRMAAICDVYDAITSARPYKPAWNPAVALGRMASWAGHFDRRLLAAFVSMLSPYPVGTLVRLASGRVGVVVQPSPEMPRKAVVRVFYDDKARTHISPRRIDLARGDDEIAALELESAWSADVLKAVRRGALLAA